jgi:hypothetical protein
MTGPRNLKRSRRQCHLRPSVHPQPTVDVQNLAVDERALLGGKKSNGCRDLLHRTHAANWNLLDQRLGQGHVIALAIGPGETALTVIP